MLLFDSAQTSRRILRQWAVCLCVTLMLALWPLGTFAATIDVDGSTCTLSDAVVAANTDSATGGCDAGDAGADTLRLTASTYAFASGVHTTPFTTVTALPAITSTIVISGGVGGAILERTGVAQYGLLYVDGGDLTLEHVTIRYFHASQHGGAIINRAGQLTLIDSGIISNTADSQGAGIYSYEGSTATLTNSDVISNTASNDGGGFYNNSGSIANFTDSDFIANYANSGGGFYNRNSTATFTNTHIISNTANANGGAFYNNNSTILLTNGELTGNHANENGGGFFNHFGGTAMLTNTSIISNTANANGGGFYNNASTSVLTTTAILTNTTITANYATENGGGFSNYSDITLTNSDVISNSAVGRGGGFYAANGTATLVNSDVISNAATTDGGGFYSLVTSVVAFSGAEISSNTAAENGGGIYINGPAQLTNAVIISNSAETSSGGVYISSSGTAVLTDTNVIANRAPTVDGIRSYGIFTSTGLQLLDHVGDGLVTAFQQEAGQSSIEQSCIVNNAGIAVAHQAGSAVDAPNNWWGSPDGPSGVASGVGDGVGSNVTYSPFLTAAILGCPTRAADVAFSKQVSAQGDLLPGQPVTYTLTVTNTGDNEVRKLYLSETLPADFQLSSVITTGQPISISGSSLFLSTLPPTQTAQIAYVGQVDPTLSSAVTLTNTAVLTHLLAGIITATVSNNVIIPVVSWSEASYAADEDSGTFTATVVLSPTTPYVTVTVQVLITDSLAALAASALQNLTFPPNSGSQPVVVNFTNDGEIISRTIELALQSSTGALLGGGISIPLNLVESDATPGIALDTRVNTTDATAGDTITYTYRITNTGNVTLTTISAVDDRFGAVTGLAGELAPAITRTSTITYLVQQSDVPWPLVNNVVISGTDIFNTVVSDQESVSVDTATPQLVIVASTNITQATVGDTITYIYRITNTGDVTLTNISALDARLGAVAGLVTDELAPTDSRNEILSYVVQPSDLPGPLVNTIVVTGTDIFSTVVTATNSVTVAVKIDPAPAITISQSAHITQATVGDIITYTYRITNTGNVTLTAINALDGRLGAVTALTVGELPPAATRSATLTYSVQSGDLPGPLTSIVIVAAQDSFDTVVTGNAATSVALIAPDDDGDDDPDDDPSDDAAPALVISQHASPAQATVGETIIYTYLITNTGNITLTNINALDGRLGTVAALTVGELAPDATRSATLTYLVQSSDLPGPLTSLVIVTAQDSFNTVATSSASVEVILIEPTDPPEPAQLFLPRLRR